MWQRTHVGLMTQQNKVGVALQLEPGKSPLKKQHSAYNEQESSLQQEQQVQRPWGEDEPNTRNRTGKLESRGQEERGVK